MTKSIIYYTDNNIDDEILLRVQSQLVKSGLPIVSVSLRPINFGENIVLDKLTRSYPTMVTQIVTALEHSNSEIVFFCEHDVLYHPSRFDFTPARKDIYYYNSNIWRWDYPYDRVIRYDRLISLSGLCVYRELVLAHYWKRLKRIQLIKAKNDGGEPSWVRKMGYEPGTKKKKRGGFSDEDFETWSSKYPDIDIRHKGTFSPPKVTLESLNIFLQVGRKRKHRRYYGTKHIDPGP